MHFNIKIEFRIFSIEHIGFLWTYLQKKKRKKGVVAAHIFLSEKLLQ